MRTQRRHLSAPVACLPPLLLLAAHLPSFAHADTGGPSFSRDILPVLSENCFTCHGPDEKRRKGNLRLDLQGEAMKPAKSGRRAIVPGRPDESELLRRINTTDQDEMMPPEKAGKHLTPSQKELIARWIAEGALWQSHWAYSPLRQPAIPAVRNPAWPRNAIDRFVLARLEREGLSPAPEADRITLLRRLTLDLTGLPPTPEEADAFLSDPAPDAYEKVVNRLMTSPHYGERMALPWLDAARYADSNGFQQDGDTHQYAWRDWVVRAMNRNLPFDQFTIEQLAGDLLPGATVEQQVATGFNRCHMLNGEGGAIAEEQRNVNVFDRVDVTATTWLGVTMACSQCHDHKYDPFTMRDYYQLFAFFNNVPETGAPSGGGQYRLDEPTVFTGSDSQVARRNQLKSAVAAATVDLEQVENGTRLQSQLAQWVKAMRAGTAIRWVTLNPVEARRNTSTPIHTAADGSLEFTPPGTGEDVLTLSFSVPPEGLTGVQLEFAPRKEASAESPARTENSKLLLTELQLIAGARTVAITNPVADELPGAFPASKATDGDPTSGWLWPINAASTRRLVVEPTQPLVRPPGKLTVTLALKATGLSQAPLRFRISATTDLHPAAAVALPTNILARLPAGPGPESATPPKEVRDYFLANHPPAELIAARTRVQEEKAKLEELQKQMARVMVMSDDKPRRTRILERGNYEIPRDEVHADTPASLPPLPAAAPRNRLGLARWLVSPENPLTARVQANRQWQLFFGRGLVRTSENLGTQSEPPVHPELLDWLAAQLRDQAWDVKRLQRIIVTSATYRQSSRAGPAARERDPENQLFARGARFRLPSLLLRDVALAASGLLDATIGGKPVYPYQPKGIWDGLAITKERDFTYPQSTGRALYRRSLYTFWRRTVAPGNMFDASVRQTCKVRPSLTSTPLHALTTLNDVTWVEAGRALAQRVMKTGATATPQHRLREAFRLVCARPPAPEDLVILLRNFERSLAFYRSDPKAALDLLAAGESPRDPGLDPGEHAAYASVCLMILNLDEALTRE